MPIAAWIRVQAINKLTSRWVIPFVCAITLPVSANPLNSLRLTPATSTEGYPLAPDPAEIPAWKPPYKKESLMTIPPHAYRPRNYQHFVRIVFSENLRRFFRNSPISKWQAVRNIEEARSTLHEGIGIKAGNSPGGVQRRISIGLNLEEAALQLQYLGDFKALLKYFPSEPQTEIEFVKEISPEEKISFNWRWSGSESENLLKYTRYF